MFKIAFLKKYIFKIEHAKHEKQNLVWWERKGKKFLFKGKIKTVSFTFPYKEALFSKL